MNDDAKITHARKAPNGGRLSQPVPFVNGDYDQICNIIGNRQKDDPNALSQRRPDRDECVFWKLAAAGTPLGVIFDPPSFNDTPRVRDRQEPVLVEALVAKAPVEAFYVRILNQFAWTDEAQANSMSEVEQCRLSHFFGLPVPKSLQTRYDRSTSVPKC